MSRLADAAMLASLDFVYTPTPDVDAAAQFYEEVLGGELVWKVRAMGTAVAAVRFGDRPLVLLAGHLHGETPILVYRTADYAAATTALTAAGVVLEELEIPHGPCAVFRAAGGQLLAVYELTRPGAVTHFDGRFD